MTCFFFSKATVFDGGSLLSALETQTTIKSID
jgi:hypothetical protein